MGHLLEKRGDSSQVILAFYDYPETVLYVDGADPEQPEFYRGLCAQFGVAYEDFLQMFSSARVEKSRPLKNSSVLPELGVCGRFQPSCLSSTGKSPY